MILVQSHCCYCPAQAQENNPQSQRVVVAGTYALGCTSHHNNNIVPYPLSPWPLNLLIIKWEWNWVKVIISNSMVDQKG